MSRRKLLQQVIEVTLAILFVAGCGAPAATLVSDAPPATPVLSTSIPSTPTAEVSQPAITNVSIGEIAFSNDWAVQVHKLTDECKATVQGYTDNQVDVAYYIKNLANEDRYWKADAADVLFFDAEGYVLQGEKHSFLFGPTTIKVPAGMIVSNAVRYVLKGCNTTYGKLELSQSGIDAITVDLATSQQVSRLENTIEALSVGDAAIFDDVTLKLLSVTGYVAEIEIKNASDIDLNLSWSNSVLIFNEKGQFCFPFGDALPPFVPKGGKAKGSVSASCRWPSGEDLGEFLVLQNFQKDNKSPVFRLKN